MPKKDKVSHELILERIDGMKEHLSFQVKDLRKDFQEHKKDIKESVKDMSFEIKRNSEFRLKAKGILGMAAFLFASLGGFIVWFGEKSIKLFYRLKGGG